ncbi:hypothetical protein SLEP1_g6131 [Rubroshorea leprosula]|uniref:DUF641 domain-containing protein n=1 Tax=Rubroshorea leprosula TaxID=152421 RepID=A0AAV5I329_9ROSI|nr:hypothetical protein SLEP1_g6131 [Rubroshorea leprosula]
METVRPKSAHRSTSNGKSRLSRTFHKVINLRTATKISSTNGMGICVLTSQNKSQQEEDEATGDQKHGVSRFKQKAVMEALLAKLFAGVTTIKAAYAELQMAQHPYNSDAIHAADQAVVEELRTLSELKRKFLKKELNLSPQVTLMLAEIQEQQSLIRTFEITVKKLESETEVKNSSIDSLKKQLEESRAVNKSLEKRLNASGPLSMFDNVQLRMLNPTHFVQFLHCVLRSVRSFVKMMIREMEVAQWDLDAAAKIIEPETRFPVQSHRCFVFESFVYKTMLEGFNSPDFSLTGDSKSHKYRGVQYFDEFRNLKSANPKHLVAQNPQSSFSKFIRSKFLSLVHAKMECSLFGNLNQRKLLISGGFPETAFFMGFAEMAKRVWLLHRMAFSLHEEVSIFQVKKGCRFSEVYMENVADDSLFSTEIGDANVDIRVSFTVVPGFKIGQTVIQSLVYSSPAIHPPNPDVR